MYNIYKNHFSWYFLAYGQVSNLRWKTKKLLNAQCTCWGFRLDFILVFWARVMDSGMTAALLSSAVVNKQCLYFDSINHPDEHLLNLH